MIFTWHKQTSSLPIRVIYIVSLFAKCGYFYCHYLAADLHMHSQAAFHFSFYALPSLTSLLLINLDVRHWLCCTSADYWWNPCIRLNWNVLSPWSLAICNRVDWLFTFFNLINLLDSAFYMHISMLGLF